MGNKRQVEGMSGRGSNNTVTMWHYGHGYFRGGISEVTICPSITIASWQANHGILEYEGDTETRKDGVRKADKKALREGRGETQKDGYESMDAED